MDFNDTPEEAEFRAEARSWLEANAKPLALGQRRASPMGGEKGLLKRAREWQATKADAGWACIRWPKRDSAGVWLIGSVQKTGLLSLG